MQIQGGPGAPFHARSSVLSHLGGQLTSARADEAALIVSELVTNSVIHADVGPSQTLTVRCAILEDRLRITVTDPGSSLVPELRTSDHTEPGGLGLQIVDKLSAGWGVTRDSTERTSVWCDLLLERPASGVGIRSSD